MVTWLRHPCWADIATLRSRWLAAVPFPHLILDDLLSQADLAELMEILDDEAVEFAANDIYAFDATAPRPGSKLFAQLRDEFADSLAPVLSLLFGRPVTRADMRAYAYRPGHYLLPHTDYEPQQARMLAYAYYLPTPEPPVGGELDLFACELDAAFTGALDGGEMPAALGLATLAQRIAPKPNRCVIFEVRPNSLHQVNEVLSGLRLSLAGWFYP